MMELKQKKKKGRQNKKEGRKGGRDGGRKFNGGRKKGIKSIQS